MIQDRRLALAKSFTSQNLLVAYSVLSKMNGATFKKRDYKDMNMKTYSLRKLLSLNICVESVHIANGAADV